MTVIGGQNIVVLFPTSNPTTGAAENASVGPVGALYVNGVLNGAVVTIANLAVGVYTASATLPALAAGDIVTLRVAATVVAAGQGVIWQESADGAYISSRAVPGDAMALTPAERISTAGVFLATILEGAHTVADGLRVMLAALAGRSTGGGTFANRFRDVGNTKNRIDATVDANGNRTAITIDGTP